MHISTDGKAVLPRAHTIPHYALYGDNAPAGWSNMFNFEWIPERSSLYEWEIQPHLHGAFLQVLFMSEGEGHTLLNDSRWAMRAPALVLVPAGHVHGFEFNPRVNGVVVTAAQRPLESMAGVVMPELMQTLRTPMVMNLPEGGRHTEGLMPLFRAIEREWRMPAAGQVAAGLSLLTALMVQVARLNDTLEPSVWPASSRKGQQLEVFRRLVDEHFRERLGVADYAARLGITAGQLTRLTRESLGMSSIDVINDRVLHEAQRDLIYTVSSIKQIAASLGFEDEAYFGRFFRKHTGLSPQAYRMQALARLGSG